LSGFFSLLERDALLHITGPDALKFLQGQTTCDTRKIEATQASPGAYCTPQGRVVCDFLLSQLGEAHFALRLRRDIRDSSAAVFGKYIVFSKAELDSARDDWAIVACWGEDARAALADIFDKTPSTRYAAVSKPGAVLVQLDEQGEAFECYIDNNHNADLLERIAQNLDSAPENEWETQQIRNGIARIEAATAGEFIPQMLNYDLTGHVSFNKGCYTGQEVVARMHYRGKSKRRMYLGQLPAAAEPGAPLYVAGQEQSAGNIVNCAAHSGGISALLVATDNGVATGLHLQQTDDGPAIAIGTLPYAVAASED
tara:strand:+ start:163157 stop:164092 length:936 start_codon:yes stop_codon:yes gene_type:complete